MTIDRIVLAFAGTVVLCPKMAARATNSVTAARYRDRRRAGRDGLVGRG